MQEEDQKDPFSDDSGDVATDDAVILDDDIADADDDSDELMWDEE